VSSVLPAAAAGKQPGRIRRFRVRAASSVILLTATGAAGIAFAPAALASVVPCSAASLISAINSANTGGGTLTLTSGCTYTLTAKNNTTDGGVGLPVIKARITIQGNGATITRSGSVAFHLLDVASAGNLTLSSLTMTNGLANDGVNGGGAIDSHGTLSVSGSTFSGNSSPATSGTSGGAINSSGTLTVTTSTFTGNTAQEGGGIFNQKTATITNSTFSNNTATIYGGGALLNAAGTETLAGDTFTGNSGPGGGAIDNDTTLNISDSTFTGNTAGGNGGGGVQNFGTTTITQSTFSGNSSPYGANIYNYTGFSLAISMSVVAAGVNGSNCGGQAPITDRGYNIDTGSSCGFSGTSMNNTQPQLGTLASNGGPTQTMALPAGSPAVNAIPASTSGCTGTTDQRGTTRPQGSGCDVGAYELIITSGDTQPPTVPTGLAVTGVTAHSVSLSWNASTDNVGVTGYTVYRNGSSVGTTGGANATSFTDTTAAPSTTYSYTVDAFDGAGNHSAQSSPPVQATTPAAGAITAVQSGAISTPGRVSSAAIPLGGVVQAGDLLVGWFAQYDSTGQVQVSDNVNGAWTRASASTTFSNGGGDIALYYVQNSKAAPFGLTVTVSSSSPTYLEGAAGEYSGVATSAALDQAVAAKGSSASPNSGSTPAVGAGELVVGGIVTGGSPGNVTAGTGFTMRVMTSGESADLEDILASTAGPQAATATFSQATDWYSVVAVFHPTS
jgi:chitodextrinase